MSREEKVARLGELEDGQMMQVEVGGTAILLVRDGERVHALGAQCPHYGAPLAEGTLHGGRIVCPWHQAVFAVASGDLLEPPARDGLPCYEVRIEGDEIYVSAPDESVARDDSSSMARRNEALDPRTFVILGAGAAGSIAAETLRQEGFAGRLILVSEEDRLPYDRPNCSKEYLAGHAEPEWMPLRDAAFYQRHDIELVTAAIQSFDTSSLRLELDEGMVLRPDGALIATGGVPRTLAIEGAELAGVHTLRSWADADLLIDAAGKAERVAVVGAGFIGLEVAASLVAGRGLPVTVIAPDAVPLESSLGREVGKVVQDLHTENGTSFALGRTVKRLCGDGHVEAVELDDGSTVKADLVVLGVGVRPATDFLTGTKLNDDGSIDVDDQLRVTDRVWAAGDIARFPNAQLGGERSRIEHWRLAQQHGRAAARSMAGRGEPFTGVPFFWTRHFDTSFSHVGHAPSWDEVILAGEPEKRDFVAYYLRDGRPLAASGTRSTQLGAFAELLRENRLPSAQEFRNDAGLTLEKLLREAT